MQSVCPEACVTPRVQQMKTCTKFCVTVFCGMWVKGMLGKGRVRVGCSTQASRQADTHTPSSPAGRVCVCVCLGAVVLNIAQESFKR